MSWRTPEGALWLVELMSAVQEVSVEGAGRNTGTPRGTDGYGSAVVESPVSEAGADADPVVEFKERLKRFRAECGNPSFRELERLFGKLDWPQSNSAIQAKVTGATVPDRVFVETFVRA